MNGRDTAPEAAPAGVPLRESLAVSLLVTLATLWYVQPVFNLRAMDRAIYWGDVRLNVWALAWNHRVFTGHAWPYFDGNIFYPHPATLAYSEHLFGIALPMLPLHLMGAPAPLVYNIAWLLSFPLLGLATHLLCRRAGLGRVGGAVAATLTACSFVRIHHTGHLQLLWLFGLPLAVYHLDRWREHPTPARLGAWALSVLTTSLASWYLAVLVVFVHLTWWPRCVWPHRRHRPAVHAVLAALGVAVVLGMFARPYVGTSRGSLGEMRANAADAHAYLVPAAATSLGHAMKTAGSALPRWSFGEQTLYVGIVVAGLAMVGIVRVLRGHAGRPDLWAQLVVTGIASLLLSLGPSADGTPRLLPFDLLAGTEGLSLFRAPARFGLLVSLTLGCLAGAAVDGWRRPYAWVLASALVVVALVDLRPNHYELKPPQPETISPLYEHLARLPPGAVVSLPIARNHPLPWYDADYEWYATRHWQPIANGYSRFEPPGYADLATHLAGFPGSEALDAMCALQVRYVVVHARRPVADLRAAIAAAGEVTRLRRISRAGEDVLYEVACPS
ncbi:hypothetical protein [Luteitalea pratensis]|uniref:hypothetical protein n=1 Tax=Luteitalea pratensis TaxID=1855912 RepID=UPI0012FF81D0|nr:hypothetical protein [Luteitalea pratensis]